MNDEDTQKLAIELVKIERTRQDQKWGKQTHPISKWFLILSEEVGEVAKAVLEQQNMSAIKGEVVQVAAVAIACLENIIQDIHKVSTDEALDENELEDTYLSSTMTISTFVDEYLVLTDKRRIWYQGREIVGVNKEGMATSVMVSFADTPDYRLMLDNGEWVTVYWLDRPFSERTFSDDPTTD